MNINELDFRKYGSIFWERAHHKGHTIYKSTVENSVIGPDKFRFSKFQLNGYLLKETFGPLEAQCILNLISEGKEIPND